MKHGTIDISGSGVDDNLVVVDSELLFNYFRRWKIKPSFELTMYNRKLITYLEAMHKTGVADEIIIGVVGNYKYRKTVIEDILLLSYPVKDLVTEMNYGRWLEIMNPALHIAVRKRMNYNKRSAQLNEDFLAEGLIPEKMEK